MCPLPLHEIRKVPDLNSLCLRFAGFKVGSSLFFSWNALLEDWNPLSPRRFRAFQQKLSYKLSPHDDHDFLIELFVASMRFDVDAFQRKVA